MTQEKQVALWSLGVFFTAAGIMHFVNTPSYLAMMPPYIPFHEFCVYASGVCEIVFGIMVLIPRTRKIGAWGIIATLIGVYPVNIHHALSGGISHPDLPTFFENATIAWTRLPFQFVFMYWAWIFTKSDNDEATSTEEPATSQ